MGSPVGRMTPKLNIGMHPGHFSPRYGEDVGTHQKATHLGRSQHVRMILLAFENHLHMGSSGQPTIDVWSGHKCAPYSALSRISPPVLCVPYPFAGLPNLVVFCLRSYSSYLRKFSLSGIGIYYHVLHLTPYSRDHSEIF